MTKAFSDSSLLRYCNICTTAPTPDENIMPRIRITMMSFIRCPTAVITSNTTAAPTHAAPAMPIDEPDPGKYHKCHTETCTGTDAKDIGTGKRITEEGLHLKTADR